MITIRKDHYLLIQWVRWNEYNLPTVEGKSWGTREGLDRMIELGLIKIKDNNVNIFYNPTPLYSFIKNKYFYLIKKK